MILDPHSRFGRAFDFLRTRKRAYCQTFKSPHGHEVMRDMIAFCRANQSTFHPDARKAAMLDGRREVFLRIQQHLGLSVEELFDLYGGKLPIPTDEE